MGYILHCDFRRLWVKYGVPYVVLQNALQEGVHVHLQYITVNQLVSDVFWLYGALQTALLHHGKLIVKEFERTQDCIPCYWKFVKMYCFGGNITQYIG